MIAGFRPFQRSTGTAHTLTASDGHPVQIGLRTPGSTVASLDGEWIHTIDSRADVAAAGDGASRSADPSTRLESLRLASG